MAVDAALGSIARQPVPGRNRTSQPGASRSPGRGLAGRAELARLFTPASAPAGTYAV